MKITLTDSEWQKILPFLQNCPNIYIGPESECRRFLEAVLWIARSGAQWRLLPDDYGNWNTIYKRFARWSAANVFEKLFAFAAEDADLQHLLVDSTIVRAHSTASGAQKNTGIKR
jgi:transposase